MLVEHPWRIALFGSDSSASKDTMSDVRQANGAAKIAHLAYAMGPPRVRGGRRILCYNLAIIIGLSASVSFFTVAFLTRHEHVNLDSRIHASAVAAHEMPAKDKLQPHHLLYGSTTTKMAVKPMSGVKPPGKAGHPHEEDKKEVFEQKLAVEIQAFFAELDPPAGPLDDYGLMKRYPKTAAWLKEESTSKFKPQSDKDHLVSAADFESKGKLAFKSTDSLLEHIFATVQEHQRFLLMSQLELKKLISKVSVNSKERKVIEKKISLMTSYSAEYSRLLRDELEDYMDRTGHVKKSREILNGLRRTLRDEIQRRQSHACARTVKYKLRNPHGFASGIHEVLRNLVRTFIENKRLVVDTSDWHYLRGNLSWNGVFQPLSLLEKVRLRNSSDCTDVPVIQNTFTDLYDLPKDIAEPLVRHHRDPYAWWLGQFMGYILRPSTSTVKLIERMKQSLGFKSPIVGLHIRRTDKNAEAKYHAVEEYMAHVEEHFIRLKTTETKRVFVATDEPAIIDELRVKFPEYTILSNIEAAKLAKKPEARDGKASFEGFLVDMYLLAETDKVVCTLSSGVCRVVYEMMQAASDDATNRVVSLDVAYYYAYLINPPRQVLSDHEPAERSGYYLNVGDRICQVSNSFVLVESMEKAVYDGFSVGGQCGSASLAGKYPTYKTLPMVRTVNWTIF